MPRKSASPSALAFLSFEDTVLPPEAEEIDLALKDSIQNALQCVDFTPNIENLADLVAFSRHGPTRVILVGAGRKEPIDTLLLEKLAAHAYNAVQTSGLKTLEIRFPTSCPQEAAHIALGVHLASYRFDKYHTDLARHKKPGITQVRIIVKDVEGAKAAYQALAFLADAIFFTRDQVSEPANTLYPSEFSKRLTDLAVPGLEIEVLGTKQLADLRMNALLGVGQGSARETQLVVMRWQGASNDSQPIGLVGKGVCFDSGGLSLKNCKGMETMKVDMAGAATVASVIYLLALKKEKVNVVGILPLAENMPGGQAQRPGDIVASMSGKTIEIVDTDAEGRLMLSDALWYCRQRFNPVLMVDVATLTGATVALGQEYAAMFSSDNMMSEQLLEAAGQEGEQIWRLPLARKLQKKLESSVADLKNYDGPEGGAISAALFLEQFTDGCPWAHLDIADVAWNRSSPCPTTPAGATGFGVRTLSRFISNNYRKHNNGTI